MLEPTKSPRKKYKNSAIIPAEIIALFGIESDSDLARKSGLSRSVIRHARLARGIETNGEHHLPLEIINKLGTMRDGMLADLCGRSESTIRSARERREIPRFVPSHVSILINEVPEPDTDAHLQGLLAALTEDQHAFLKAKMPHWTLARISRATGLHVNDLFALRKHLKIPAFALRVAPSPALLSALGKEPDRVVASKFNVKYSWVHRVRNAYYIAPYKSPAAEVKIFTPLLGKVADKSLSRYFGNTPYAYRSLRKRLGIPAYPVKGRYSSLPNDNVRELLEQFSAYRIDDKK